MGLAVSVPPRRTEVVVRPSVWIFCDTPVGGVFGASYMAESWGRTLRDLGWNSRIVAPSGSWRSERRTGDELSFRTLPNIGYRGDQHAIYSVAIELLRARRRLPDVVLVTTPLRVGALGFALSYYFKVPLVVAVSTDTTGMAQYYNSSRMMAASWPKLAAVTLRNKAVRRAMLGASVVPERRNLGWSAAFASKVVGAMQAQAAEMIMLGEQSVATYAAQGGESRISVFPAGIDRLPEASGPGEVTWPDGALRMLYVGRFSKEKTLHLLVDAVAQARQRGVDVHLNMIGGGHCAAELTAQARALGVSEHVTLYDAMERKDLGGVYASADFFAFPSIVDTQAFVLNEAAHEGLPLLVADPINPVVEHNVTGLVVGHDAAAFAAGIDALDDGALRGRLGAAAQVRALEFTEDGQAEQLSAVLARACRRGPGGLRVAPVGGERALAQVESAA